MEVTTTLAAFLMLVAKYGEMQSGEKEEEEDIACLFKNCWSLAQSSSCIVAIVTQVKFRPAAASSGALHIECKSMDLKFLFLK